MDNLGRESIEEFIQIYKQEFGIELEQEEAAKKARELLELFAILTKYSEDVVE